MLACASDNRKAVELNSAGLSEWCMDDSPGVWGGPCKHH